MEQRAECMEQSVKIEDERSNHCSLITVHRSPITSKECKEQGAENDANSGTFEDRNSTPGRLINFRGKSVYQ
ncbi:hypothetical protein [Sunxiuqinia rutila]|uniref:hypothetical protein n=1 Tax=Sunxiuqinia rutila TaxID=1397841 RepID=UPI003D36625D